MDSVLQFRVGEVFMRRSNLHLLCGILLFVGSGSTVRGDETILQTTAFGFASMLEGIESIPDKMRSVALLESVKEAMQQVPTRQGVPPCFSDANALLDLEMIFAFLSPFVCKIQNQHVKNFGDQTAVLSGMVGGLIGNIIANQNLEDAADVKPMLSGLGVVAGAIGSLSGHYQDENFEIYFKRPSNVNNLQRLLLGEFNFPRQSGYRLVQSKIANLVNSMAPFVTSLAQNLEKKKVPNAGALFPHLDERFVASVRSVTSMSAVVGGLLGKFATGYKKANSRFSHFVAALASLKKQKMMMGRTTYPNIFETIVDDLIVAAESMSRYAGMAGAKIGEVVQSIGNAGGTKVLGRRLDLMEDKQAMLQGAAEILHGLEASRQVSGRGVVCIANFMAVLAEFGTYHQFQGKMPADMNYVGPYSGAGSADYITLQAYLVRQQLDSWNSSFAQLVMAGNLQPENFAQVFESLDNGVLQFVDHIARAHGLDANLLKFMRGEIAIEALTQGEIEMMPISVLASLQPGVIATITKPTVVSVLQSPMLKRQPERLIAFLKSVDDSRFLAIVDDFMSSGTAFNSPKVMGVVLGEYGQRAEDARFQQTLCSFLPMLKRDQISRFVAEQFSMESNGIPSCLMNQANNLNCEQMEAVAEALVGESYPGSLNFTQMGPYMLYLPSELQRYLVDGDVVPMVENGYFKMEKKCLCQNNDPRFLPELMMSLDFRSNEPNISYFELLGNTMCGMSSGELLDFVNPVFIDDFKAVWSQNCAMNATEHAICKKRKQAAQEDHWYTKQRQQLSLRRRAEAIISTIELPTLSGNLPENVSEILSAFTLQDLDMIPSEIFMNSIDSYSGDEMLSGQQKRLILGKLVEAGLELQSKDALKSIGSMAAELNTTDVDPSVMNGLLNEDPHLMKSFKKSKIFYILNELLNSEGVDSLVGNGTVLSKFIPTSHLQQLNLGDFQAVAKLKWTKEQGMALINIYKSLNGIKYLGVNDISVLGGAAIGLTCDDVQQVLLEKTVEFIIEVDHALHGEYSAVLANCLAMKLHLFLRLETRQTNIPQLLGSVIPANILMFLPSEILELAGQQCRAMGKKIKKADYNLLPLFSGQIFMGQLSQASHCRNEQDRMGPGPSPGGPSNGPMPNDYPNYPQYGQPPSDYSNMPNQQGNYPQYGQMPGNPSNMPNQHGSYPQYGQPPSDYSNMPNQEGNYPQYGQMPGNPSNMPNQQGNYPQYGQMQGYPSSGPNDQMSYPQQGRMSGNFSNMSNGNMSYHQYGHAPGNGSVNYPQYGQMPGNYSHYAYQNGQMYNGKDQDMSYLVQRMINEAVSQIMPHYGHPMATVKPEPKLFGDKTVKMIRVTADLGLPGDGPSNHSLPVSLGAYYEMGLAMMSNGIGLESIFESNSSYVEDYISLDMLMELGPAVVGIDVFSLQYIGSDVFEEAISVFGQHKRWKPEQLDVIRSRMLHMHGTVDEWSKFTILGLGHLAAMLNASHINLLHMDLDVIGSLSEVEWPSSDQRRAVLQRYMDVQNMTIGQLQGFELAAFGDLACGFSSADIMMVQGAAVKFALPRLSRVRCFDDTQLEAWKEQVAAVLDVELTSPLGLAQLGILAAGLTEDELRSIKPAQASLFHSDALRVIAAQKILNAWNNSHFALMGITNGGVVMTRLDIFKLLSNTSRNAVFNAAFGTSAGYMGSFLRAMQEGSEYSERAFSMMMESMMWSVNLLFSHIKKKSSFQIGSVYGLADPSQFVKPPTKELQGNLEKSQFGSLNKRLLEDNRIIDFINANSGNEQVIDVLKGSISFNDLDKSNIEKIPAKVLIGMKSQQIREINGASLSVLFDSEIATKDPENLKKFLRKLDVSQLEDAMTELNAKMAASASSKPWRPPIVVQESLTQEILRRIKKTKMTPEETCDFVVKNLCPLAAGFSPSQIQKIPAVASKVDIIVECFASSYHDLEKQQRKAVAKWIFKSVSASSPLKYGSFFLDLPGSKIPRQFSAQQVKDVLKGTFIMDLDPLNEQFVSFSKLFMKSLLQANKSFFDQAANFNKLGQVVCHYPFTKLKKQLPSNAISHAAPYLMQHCTGMDALLQESLEECTPELAHRLKRCEILIEKAKPAKKEKRKRKTKVQKVEIAQFQMMRDIASTLIADKNLQTLDGTEVKEMASALSGFAPSQLKELPDSAVLSALDDIKENKVLSKKQKKIMLRKAQKAGFTISNSTSLSELGELVTALPAKDLKKIPPSDIKNNLKDLQKRASEFSVSQRKAIVKKLEELEVDELLNQDLGVFAAEIPLKKLKELTTINLTVVNDKPWDRGQAARLVEMYTSSSSEQLNADKIRELGSTVVGLKCSNIMDVVYNEILEVTVAIDDQVDMSLDMDECMLSKLHNSKQIELGINYMQNDSDAELPVLLGSVPSDVSMFYSYEVVNATPSHACGALIEQIGKANLDELPMGPGDLRRKQLATAGIKCLLGAENRTSPMIDENDLITLGSLLCDIPASYITELPLSIGDVAIDLFKPCLRRLSGEHVVNLLQLVVDYYDPDPSTWSSDALNLIGPIVTLLPSSTIASLDTEQFSDSLPNLFPPEMDPNDAVSRFINYNAFYDKAIDSLVASGSDASLRRKRSVTAPTYDLIMALGLGNTRWEPDQLTAISDDDLASSLQVLGSIDQWSTDQLEALCTRLKEVYSAPSEWEADTVADAKHLLKHLTPVEIAVLDLTDIDTVASLSEVDWSADQRVAAFDAFLAQNTKTMGSLSAEDLTALGVIVCGAASSEMMSLSMDVVSESLRDLGLLTCYEQDQLDVLLSIVLLSNDNYLPDSPLLQEMGTIAAGLNVDELQQIPVESMPFITSDVFAVISPDRVSNGLSSSQLAASGIENVAALMATPRLYDALGQEQKEALQLAAFGRLIENATDATTNAPFTVGIDIFAGGEDNAAGTMVVATASNTQPSGTDALLRKRQSPIVFSLSLLVYCVTVYVMA